MSRFAKLAMVGAAVLTAAPVGAFAQGRPAKASNAQKMQEAASAEVPTRKRAVTITCSSRVCE